MKKRRKPDKSARISADIRKIRADKPPQRRILCPLRIPPRTTLVGVRFIET